ncbi:MAG: two-component sensor histidine kinase, partial [Novosphingobium sp.]
MLPRSLKGQMLLAIALALLVAQAISAALLYRALEERREAALVGIAAFRLVGDPRERAPRPPGVRRPDRERLRVELLPRSPLRPGEERNGRAERALAEVLAREGVAFADVVVIERPVAGDLRAQRWVERRHARQLGQNQERPKSLILAAIHRPDGRWLLARVLVPSEGGSLLGSLVGQALLIYAVLVGAVALLLRQITRPLAALTRRMERFAETRDSAGPLVPAGPDDVRRLMAAHNAMEARIVALLDEKDVMLGAIGHDLKTPLAALRVRIESVDDDAERGRMAAVIEDINQSLDDILTLARVGRPSDPAEPTELAALAGAV